MSGTPGSDDKTTVDLNDPKVQAAINDAVSKKESALKADIDALKGERDKFAETAKAFEGLDAKEVRALLDERESGRHSDLLKNGEYEKLIEEKTSKISEGFKKQIDEVNKRLETTSAERDSYRSQIAAAEIKSAALEAGVAKTALDDVVLRSNGMFTVDEHGKLVASEGNVNDKGNPVALSEYITGLRETAPHLFGQASGTGAQGNKSRVANGGKLYRSQMTAEEKSEYRKEHGMEAFLALPLNK